MSDYNKKETIVHAVAEDDGLQFYWTMLSIDIESEEQAVKLLKEIMATVERDSAALVVVTCLRSLYQNDLGILSIEFLSKCTVLWHKCQQLRNLEWLPKAQRTGSNAAEPCTRNETVLKQN